MSPTVGSTFADWQPRYADAGIATFPVREKRPAIRGYLKISRSVSRKLAQKYPDDAQFGFACRPSGITVLDIDDRNERVLSDALSEFGPTPIIVRSGSGNFQAWYRHNGEGRQVRPDPTRPIDILGHGFVVAPPSVGGEVRYHWLEGSLEDVPSLPVMRRPALLHAPRGTQQHAKGDLVRKGNRNDTLWRLCMERARLCASIEELMDAAVRLNQDTFFEPLPDAEVIRIVASAWSKELSGANWFGSGRRLVVDHADVDGLMQEDPDAFILLTKLKRHHWGRPFVVANAMHKTMPAGGWRRERFTAARNRLELIGEIILVTPASRHSPAVYRFKGAQN